MLFWLFVAAVVAAFAVVNWQVLTAPTAIDLMVAQVTAPLGLIMLSMLAGLVIGFLLFVVWLETRVLMQSRSGFAQPTGGDRARADAGGVLQGFASHLERLEQVVAPEFDRVTRRLEAQVDRLDATAKRVS